MQQEANQNLGRMSMNVKGKTCIYDTQKKFEQNFITNSIN